MLKDEDIIQGCKKFKPAMQQALYEKFSELLFGTCLRYASNREEAKDLMHEGFLKIFTKIDQYKGDGSFEGWMRRIMVNTSLMYLREKKKISFESLHSKEEYTNIKAEEEDPDDSLLFDLKNVDFSQEELLKTINQLPENNKIIFNLFYIEKYSHKEISDLLSINETTSRTRLLRSKKLMREYLIQLSHEKLKEVRNI